MQTLIKFNVDIYIQGGKKPSPAAVNIPLWVKDYGWSQQGLSRLIELRQGWYLHQPKARNAEAGERIAVVNGESGTPSSGIGVIRSIDDKTVWFSLFGTRLHSVPLKQVRWSDRNNRWETPTCGSSTGLRRATA